MKQIDKENILYIENSQDTTITYVDGYRYLSDLSLDKLEEELSGFDFFRYNNDLLINLAHIEVLIPNSSGRVLMDDGLELRLNEQLKNKILDKIESL